MAQMAGNSNLVRSNLPKPKKSLESIIGTTRKKTIVEKPTKKIVTTKSENTDQYFEDNINNNIEEEQVDLVKLFGIGFTPQELEMLYDTYQSYLNNYPLTTAMHKMALIKVCKCTLRYNQALAENDLDSLKVWDAALSKALKEAKINPEQLSRADLSDGINNFSKIAEAVEREMDIIPILPHFKQKPQDVVDYTIWQYINYIRRLQNLPTIKYHEIYKFMDEMYQHNIQDLPFIQKEKDGKYDDEDGDF